MPSKNAPQNDLIIKDLTSWTKIIKENFLIAFPTISSDEMQSRIELSVHMLNLQMIKNNTFRKEFIK